MKTFICLVASLIALLASVVIRAQPEIHNTEMDIFVRPGNDELWCVSVQPQTLDVFDTSTLQLLRSNCLAANPITLAFDGSGDHVYIVTSDPDGNGSYIVCHEADGFQLQSQAPLSGIACGVCVHENGYVYATSQDPVFGGYIQKFAPLSLGLAASADTQSWPAALCVSPSSGLIYVGGTDEFDGDGLTEPEVYSKVLIYDPLDLALVGEIHAGLHHSLFISTDSLLVIQNFGCASFDQEFQDLLKGLTILETESENVLLDWQVYPNVLRGSCFEPMSGKWFGCTFSSKELTGSELWMICDLTDPLPQSLGVFPDSRVTRMVAFPLGADQIRLVGIDSQNENLFVHDVPSNAAPQARFSPVPPSGQAPLTVDFMNYSSDCDGDVVEIQADWNNDGITDEIFQGSPGVIEHEFVDPGTYIVKLTVVDDDSATDDWTGTISVAD